MSCWKNKNRGRNFTPEEEVVLTILANEKKSILENRKSDALTWRRKVEAWKEIADCYYVKTGYRREWKTLREKCNNMKRRRKIQKNSLRSTNDDDAVQTKVEPSLPGELTTSLSNPYDSEASDVDNNMSFVDDEDILPHAQAEHELSEGNNNIAGHEDDLATTSSDWANGNLSRQTPPQSRKRSIEQETLTLIRLQQDFVRCKNQRAQERHEQDMLKEKAKLDQELQTGKLRIQLIELEIMEKKAKLNQIC